MCSINGQVDPVIRSGYKVKVDFIDEKQLTTSLCMFTDTELEDGDKISASGFLYPLPFSTNPHQFDYGRFLLSKGQYAVFYADSVEITGKSDNIINKLRNSIRRRIKNEFSPDSTLISLILALSIGDRSSLDDQFRDKFHKGGIAHFLAISGLHVGILFLVITGLLTLAAIPKKIRYLLTAFFLIFYLIISGGNPSVWRAVVILVVFILAYIFERNRDPYHLLGIAGLIILIKDPLNLWDSGFLLSFGCVFSLVTFMPIIQQFINKNIKSLILKYFATGFMVVLVIYLGILPIIGSTYGNIFIIAFLSNIIFLPVFYVFLLSIFLFILFGPAFFSVFSNAVWLLGKLIIILTGYTSEVSLLSLQVRPFQPHMLIIYYLILFFFRLSLTNRRLLKHLLFILLIFVVAGVFEIYREKNPYIIVFDVGQGDAALIHTEKGYNILIDGGPSNWTGRNIILSYLEKSGYQKIDLLIATHPDADHITGLVHVLEEFPVEKVLYNGIDKNTEIYRDFFNAAGSGLIEIRSGDMAYGEDFHINFQSPERIDILRAEYEGEHNEASIYSLFHFIGSEIQYIFPGDKMIFSDPQCTGKVWLHISHHGDMKKNPVDVLSSYDLSYAVISVGRNNHYGHPHNELVEYFTDNDIELYRTDYHGAVKFFLPEGDIKCYNNRFLWHRTQEECWSLF